jgi:drug/metabolite transporter (DMT)-like permease
MAGSIVACMRFPRIAVGRRWAPGVVAGSFLVEIETRSCAAAVPPKSRRRIPQRAWVSRRPPPDPPTARAGRRDIVADSVSGPPTTSSLAAGGVERPGMTALDWLLLLGPGLIWGASFLFIAEALESIGPYGVTFVRLGFGFLTLGLVPAARRAVPRAAWPGIAGMAVIWMALPLSLFPFAELRVSSALTGMLNGANPLFTAIVAAGLARRMPSRGVIVGLAVGMTGTVLIAWPSLGEGRSSIEGVAMILAAVVCYGFALNLARPLQQRYGALPTIWRAQALAILLTAPLGLPDLVAARWRPGPLISLLALGALGTGLAYVLLAEAAGRVGATRASATTFLIPAVALALGVALRDERVAPLAVAGAAVCVAGAWLVRRAPLGADPLRR